MSGGMVLTGSLAWYLVSGYPPSLMSLQSVRRDLCRLTKFFSPISLFFIRVSGVESHTHGAASLKCEYYAVARSRPALLCDIFVQKPGLELLLDLG